MSPENPIDINDTAPLAVDPSNPLTVPKYVDPLPIPSVLSPKSTDESGSYYEVTMKKITQKLHRDFPETPLFAYEGVYPGPTIEAVRNVPVRVKWMNNLPVCHHLLPVDTTIHGAEPDNPTVRTVVHLHGGRVAPDSDGYPEAWFTKNFAYTGPFFTREVYYYPNEQRATTLLYHDHALGITRLNVYSGLAGFYIIRDESEKHLHLPEGDYEIPIVIQDRSFNPDGSLFYPAQPDNPPARIPNPSVVPEFFGNTIVVNGKVWPFLDVEPRKYRFRLLNGSNARFYNLKFDVPVTWVQIGNEGGFLKNPVPLTELLLAPAERADVIVDFSLLKGQSIVMTNNANAPFPNGEMPDEGTTGQIMEFRVAMESSGPDTSKIPEMLPPIEKLNPEEARKDRALTLDEATDEFGRLKLLLTGRMWDDPISEKPCLDSIETWRLINLTPDTHPIHLHLVHFQVLERRPFDVAHYLATQPNPEIIFTGDPVPPDPNEVGWKDTVRADVGMITTIIARFEGFTGIYPWHCHILEHEDHEMMRPYEVIKKPCK